MSRRKPPEPTAADLREQRRLLLDRRRDLEDDIDRLDRKLAKDDEEQKAKAAMQSARLSAVALVREWRDRQIVIGGLTFVEIALVNRIAGDLEAR